MKKFFIFVFSVFLTGCYQVKKTYFINPDGKGKVIIDAVLPVVSLNLNQNNNEKPDFEGRVKEIIEKSKGVDGWKDIKWEETEEGKLHFTGVAYFSDINSLKIGKIGILNPEMKKVNGEYLLTIKMEKGKKEKEKKKISQEEINKIVEKEKKNYFQMKPLLIGFFTDLKEEDVFYLPGEIENISNFKKISENTASIEIKGEKILKVIDEVMKDEKLSKKAILYDYSDEETKKQIDKIFYGKIFGEEKEIEIIFKPEKELFDYNSEIKDTKKTLKWTQKGSKEEKKSEQKVTPGGETGIEDVSVAGIKVVYLSDVKNGILPFSSTKGLSLAVLIKLKNKIISTTGEIKKAVSEAGENLLPENIWNRRINFPSISKSGKEVLLNIGLKLPEKSKIVKEIEGEIEYVCGGDKVEEVNSGIENFKEGEKGSFSNCKILKNEKSKWQSGKFQIDIECKIPKYKVKDIKFYDEKGNLIKSRIVGTFLMNEKTTFSCMLEKKLEYGKIVFVVYKDIFKKKESFKLNDIKIP